MDNKTALREGDSWRARVYRRKDELFNFGQEELAEFLKGIAPEVNTKISGTIVSLNRPLQTLRESADAEAAGQEAMEIISKIEAELKEAGFPPKK